MEPLDGVLAFDHSCFVGAWISLILILWIIDSFTHCQLLRCFTEIYSAISQAVQTVPHILLSEVVMS